MALVYPIVGQWFRRPNGTIFEVVALDEDAGTVEVQQFDGTIDEFDLDAWPELELAEVAAPEDWSGSVDIDPEDVTGRTPHWVPGGYDDALTFIDLNDSSFS